MLIAYLYLPFLQHPQKVGSFCSHLILCFVGSQREFNADFVPRTCSVKSTPPLDRRAHFQQNTIFLGASTNVIHLRASHAFEIVPAVKQAEIRHSPSVRFLLQKLECKTMETFKRIKCELSLLRK